MGRHSFREDDHPRNPVTGEFTTASVGDWARKVSEQIGRRDPVVAAHEAGHPAGHAEARDRHHMLWNIPVPRGEGGQGRERTDAEHDEAEQLDAAFAEYRKRLGLTRNPDDRNGRYTFVGEHGRQLYSKYGERINKPGGSYFGSPSQLRKRKLQERRSGEDRGRPAEADDSDPWLTRRTPGKRPRETFGTGPGYVMRSDVHTEKTADRAAVFVARMKQRQPRVRQETARQPVRRTPRGTKIENWMQG
jgi:hypothetical protein